MSKLWQKQSNRDEARDLFCEFTTGNDYQLDGAYFIEYDIIASKAWAIALQGCGIYTADECAKIIRALDNINKSYKSGTFSVRPEDEDCHTAIENALVLMTGEIGKKIHTGRSRNDQSLTMIRLFMRNSLCEFEEQLPLLIEKLADMSSRYQDDIFIGYSHTQQAMPITIGHYFNAFSEQFGDDMYYVGMIKQFINQCPLGTGAGFGSPLDVDRDMLSDMLGFNTVQNNSLYCQNSRGKFELLYIQCLSQILLGIQKLATDMVFYTARELALFKMSDSLSQGSSMMPQKKNPDVFELIRAKTCDVMALEDKVKLILKGLPSGYNRDLQEIKACIVDAHNITHTVLHIMYNALDHIKPDHVAIKKRLEKDIVSADFAISRCIQDPTLNFRDVYRESLSDIPLKPVEAIGLRKSKGSPGNI